MIKKYDLFLNIDEKFIPMINDMLRMFTIQFVTQLFISLTNPSIKLFNYIFIKTTLFILTGVIVYWTIIKNLLNIRSSNSDLSNNEDLDYAYVYSI